MRSKLVSATAISGVMDSNFVLAPSFLHHVPEAITSHILGLAYLVLLTAYTSTYSSSTSLVMQSMSIVPVYPVRHAKVRSTSVLDIMPGRGRR